MAWDDVDSKSSARDSTKKKETSTENFAKLQEGGYEDGAAHPDEKCPSDKPKGELVRCI